MKSKINRLLILILLAGLGFASAVPASLIARGQNMVYDTDLNITWAANANLQGSLITWYVATDWAANLNFGGYDDWRLPTTTDQICGYKYYFNCTGSELGHLFYIELGGEAYKSILTNHNDNFNLFNNIQESIYWSETGYPDYPNSAWIFGTDAGMTWGGYKGIDGYAWAVRSGDVPEPDIIWLLLAGGMGWYRNRIRQRG